MRNMLKAFLIFGLILIVSLPVLAAVNHKDKSVVTSVVKKEVAKPTADHRKFKQLKEDFKRGPEVTKACLSCHTEAAKQVHDTIHWTWSKKEKEKGKIREVGKAYILNSF